MPFPAQGWPPRLPSGIRSIRFYKTGTATANFQDNAWLFSEGTTPTTYTPMPVVTPGSNAPVAVPNSTGGGTVSASDPVPMVWSGNIRISNDGGGDLEYSFDGTNVHGKVKANESLAYRNRYEGGISVRGASAVFRIEAW